MRSGTGFLIKNTNKGSEQEVSEEERYKIEKRRKTTDSILGGTSKVVRGISLGATYVGRGIATGAHKVAETDTYKEIKTEHFGNDDKKEGDTETKDTAISVAKSTIGGAKNVLTGAAQASVIVATDVRENKAAYVEHREGKEQAELTRERFNIAGNVAMTGYQGVNLIKTTTIGLAISVGAGVASYDDDLKTHFSGGIWMEGWVARRGNVYKGEKAWVCVYAVIRSLTIAFYKSISEAYNNPTNGIIDDAYYLIREILWAQSVTENIMKRRLTLEFQHKNGVHYISFDFSDISDGFSEPSGDAETVNQWIESINSLASLQCPVFKGNKQ